MSISVKNIKSFSDLELAKEKFRNDLLLQEHILLGNLNRIKGLIGESLSGVIKRNAFRLAGMVSFTLIRKLFKKRKRQS